jgi:hypothetical protein
MKILRMAAMAFCLLLLVGGNLTRSQADDHNKQTTFTFSAPVEVPGSNGTVVLPAGTYVFKLMDSDSNRNIVQIFNEDQTHLYATVLAISNYHLTPSDKTITTFEERPEGAPEAIKAWFYPGDTFGQEFAYPKAKAVELAKENNEPVPSIPQETAENSSALQQAPVEDEQSNGEETQVAQNTPADTTPTSTTDASTTPASTLPSTASEMPLAALCGMLLLGVGICLRLLSRKPA